MTDLQKIEDFVDSNVDAVYGYVSLNLDSFLAAEDLPLDDDWEKGVEKTMDQLMNDLDYDEFMEKVGNHI